MVTTATQPQHPMGVKPPVWGHRDPCVHPPEWGHCMEAATSQKGIRSRNRDACKWHHHCFKEGSKNVYF